MPLPVSQDFHNQMKAQTRRIYGKIQVDYTDPFIDQSIQVSANENANYSYPEQVADNIEEPHGKIASLDGSWVLDGTYHLAPETKEAAEKYQMGWWGSQLSDENGNYTAPYPTLSVTFAPRPVHRLQVIGDNKRKEWPVNFTINLYSNDTLMHTETVTGNTEIFWSTDITRVNEITKMELIITKWSHANRQVKILEFFTSIQETYETDDILLINLLEEREVSQGSLPVGNISSNEIDIRLVNENGRFDAGNRQSPLYQLLKPNRRIKAWLRGEPAQIINPKPEGGHLWHFDRSVVSTDGIQPESGAVYTLRPNEGKFGGAVAVEEGTTNLFTNPRLLNNGSGWMPYSATAWVDSSGEYPYIHCEAQFDGVYQTLSLSATTYTLTYLVKHKSGSNTIGSHFDGSPSTKIRVDRGAWVNGNIITVPSDGNWHLVEIQAAYTTAGSYRVHLQPGRGVTEVSEFYFKYAQIEQKPFATSFVDGSRAEGYLKYQTGLPIYEDWTVAAWFMSPVGKTTNWQDNYLFSVADGGNRLDVSWDPSQERIRLNCGGTWKYMSVDSPGLPNEPYFIVLRNRQGELILDVMSCFGASSKVMGNIPDGLHPNLVFEAARYFGNSVALTTSLLIDELLILPYAATEEEIARWYNSNAPFYDTEIKEWVPLGTFWSGDWTAPEGEIYVQTTGRDRLELLNQSTYSNSQVRQNVTLYDLAIDVLEDYGLEPEEYFVDEELRNTVIPFAYFTPQSHREALRKIAEACLGQCYCDRDGLVRLEGYSYLQSKTKPDIVITRDDYFMKDNPANYMQIANYIEVETQPLRPAPVEEVYRSNEPVSINAGETISITAYYNVEPCIEATASVEGVGTITDVTYYSWGADVKVTSSTAGEFELVINAKPLKVLNKDVAIAKDDDSIRENGRIKYTFPKNPLVQTREQAQKIADNLLAYFKEPRRDLTIEWRGNPALLLGDRIQVVDEYGREDFFITVQNIEYDGGLRVSIEGRKVE